MTEENGAKAPKWLELGSLELWDRRMLIFAISCTTALGFLEAVTVRDYSLFWLPAHAVSLVLAVLFVVACVQLVKPNSALRKYDSLVNLFIGGSAFGLQAATTYYLSGIFGLEVAGNLLQRFVCGAALGIALLVSYAELEAAKSARTKNPVSLSRGIQPGLAAFLAFLSWFYLAPLLLPLATAIDIVIASIIYLVSLLILKLLANLVKSISVNVAMVILPILISLASLPSYYLIYQIPHEIEIKPLLPSFVVLSCILSVACSYAKLIGQQKTKN